MCFKVIFVYFLVAAIILCEQHGCSKIVFVLMTVANDVLLLIIMNSSTVIIL